MSTVRTPKWLAEIALPALLCVLIASAGCAAPLSLYVATDGNDAWSGAQLEPGQGDGPLASLHAAQAKLRDLAAQGKLADGATVFVRSGVYELAEPLVLGPQDSGKPGKPVVWRGYANERPALVGAREVTGFVPFRDGILRCELKGTDLERVAFRQLLFKGERQTLARYPNVDPAGPHGGEWAHVSEVDGPDVRDHFTYTEDFERTWAHPERGQVCIFPGYDWAWNINPIESVDFEARIITMGRDTSYALKPGDRYFVQNLLEELDAPGEWYLDSAESVLYFYPPSDITEGQVLATVLPTVVSLKGAGNVTVQGFVIEASDADAVTVDDCQECQVAGNVVRNSGGWGIRVSGGSRSGAFGNDVYGTGAGGIAVTGGDRKALEPAGNYATNNYIHHVAAFNRTYNTGINISGVGNLADHNLIHDTPHAGMTLGGNENVVEYNTVHHTNLQSADTGGIYFCSRDWTQRGNVIRYNIFHHVGGYGKAGFSKGQLRFRYPTFTWGIYLDDPTTGTEVYGNVLWAVPVCGLHNHGGRDNTFENNILIDCPPFRAGALSPTWNCWPDIYKKLHDARYEGSPYLAKYPELANYKDTGPEEMSNVRFVRNIVYYTKEGAKWLPYQQSYAHKDGPYLYSLAMRAEDFATCEFDYNCLYIEPGLEFKVQLGLRPEPTAVLTWDQWRERGVDAHSTFADPKFVDPANHDFSLQADSPALKLGFKQIPLAEIGPFADELRASWPIVEAPGVSALGDLMTDQQIVLPRYKLVAAERFATRGGAGNVFAKLAAGKPVKVAYFGGGIHPANGWRAQVIQWLRETYPASQIDETDAGICDCSRGSGFSVYRTGHDVMAKKPDLVLIDFASDDYNTDPAQIWRNVEGMVRIAWAQDPAVDLVFLYAFRQGFEEEYATGQAPPTVSAYEKLAEHYGIPSINMGFDVAKMAREGKLLVKAGDAAEQVGPDAVVFSTDGVRPSAAGNAIYARAIIDGMSALAEKAKAGTHALKPAFDSQNLERVRQVPITQDMLSGDWEKLVPPTVGGRSFSRQFDEVWATHTPGAKLTFRFKGTSAALFDLMGPDGGKYKVTVDGKDAGIKFQVDPWAYYHRLTALGLCGGLEDAEHTVTVELLAEPPDRGVAIESAKAAKQYKEEAFEGVALYVGCLRIEGEPVQ